MLLNFLKQVILIHVKHESCMSTSGPALNIVVEIQAEKQQNFYNTLNVSQALENPYSIWGFGPLNYARDVWSSPILFLRPIYFGFPEVIPNRFDLLSHNRTWESTNLLKNSLGFLMVSLHELQSSAPSLVCWFTGLHHFMGDTVSFP